MHRIRGQDQTCPFTGKRQHHDERAAVRAARRLRRNHNERVFPYRCLKCFYWHNGHDPMRRRRFGRDKKR